MPPADAIVATKVDANGIANACACLGKKVESIDGDNILGDTTKFYESLNSSTKPQNYITKLICEMKNSLIQLQAKKLSIAKLEKMAILIHESMSISTRNYHSVRHVFDLINHDERIKNKDPIAILAACFHDCIYYHVDGGLTPVQAAILKGSFKIIGPKTEEHDASDCYCISTQQIYKFFASDREQLIDTDMNSKMDLQIVETIFGYVPGQHIRITGDGLNEFLSALVAVRMLKDHLSVEILIQIACCIEATIPFRKPDQNGKTHMDKLYDNMKEVRQVYNLILSDDYLIKSVQRACLLSNCDVGNFGTTDKLYFLDNTWSLLPEMNESLRNEHCFTVDHFHVALWSMYGFFGFLQPAVVFHEFQGVPPTSEMDGLIKECSNNLAFGRTYVGAKLVAMSLLSALAYLTGGDAPISLFTGDLQATEPRGNQVLRRMPVDEEEKKINSPDGMPEERPKNCNQTVYDILAKGRRSESSFDTKRSPWAAKLYSHLGDEGLNCILKEHKLYPMTEERARSLLRALPLEPVQVIVKSISEQAPSRADKLWEIMNVLSLEKCNGGQHRKRKNSS